MTKRLLVDAAHPEETRVVVVDGTHLHAFDVESSARKQLKGNIYLAKVMRVEPSLQAAFVEFGGNRHGFLAFGDIHPDYYQIPVEDRAALLKERAAEDAAHAKAEEEALARPEEPRESEDQDENGDGEKTSGDTKDAKEGDDPDQEKSGSEDSGENDGKKGDGEPEKAENGEGQDDGGGDGDGKEHADENGDDAPPKAESVGGDDLESAPPRRSSYRRYKIQEVIKRRQVLLIQVVKEERGSKGAALTTYLSLAGRYCVLMPNTARGGGVSRKISAAADRKKLRTIIESLSVPDGMGLIVRTAGQSRTKTEIRGDYQYLMRLWESVRELTLNSTAPTLVYEDANLIKRAIRDLYSNDIPEVLVEGEMAYKAAKAVMKMLVPSHAKRVKQYTDRVPLFRRHQVEEQLDKMHMPQVTLKSGGSIVINPTEALVAIDVNSGRATRERSIEATALKTNLEASEEIAKQLALRDLAGLIVIDYIDMDQSRNNRAVERRLKDALKMDRARIQVGRISTFGLMELSRQRMRPSLLETSSDTCPTCAGIGLVRSTESAALHALRAIEEAGVRGPAAITAAVPTKVAVYLLNNKRLALTDLEIRFGVTLTIVPDADLVTPHMRIERSDPDSAEAPEATPSPAQSRQAPSRRRPAKPATDTASAEAKPQAGGPPEAAAGDGDGDDTAKPSKRRRRGKRGGRRRRRKEETPETDGEAIEGDAARQPPAEAASFGEVPPGTDGPADEAKSESAEAAPGEDATPEEKPAAKRKRAPRRRPPRAKQSEGATPEAEAAAATNSETASADGEPPSADEKPKPRRRRTRTRKPAAKKVSTEDAGTDPSNESPSAEKPADISVVEKPSDKPVEASPPAPEPAAEEAPKKPAKRGWWRSKG
jgi:ribonuclease E